MVAKIKYENIPETAVLAEDNPSSLTFDLTANGFEILFYKFKRPTIDIQVSEYYSKENENFIISDNELARIVKSKFNRNLAVKNLSVDQLIVHLDPIVLKNVKIIANTQIVFKNGFKATDSIIVEPDSVKISGPAGSLKNIEFVETELFTAKNVDNIISDNVKIANPGADVVSFSPKEVAIKLEVAEFSQGKIMLPVEVINLPPNLNIKLIQKSITISYESSVNDFSTISKENFRVVCDFSKRNEDENFMIPILEKKPMGARNVEFSPKKIDFLVFK
ncbi:CdaR family protein [Aequorivita echinoideorum]|nr:CdaR family protein [Aequorivita echinoideorum]